MPSCGTRVSNNSGITLKNNNNIRICFYVVCTTYMENLR